MKSNFLNNTIIFSIGEFVPKILSFILLPIYMQYFTPADYGIIGYTSSFFSVLPILTTLGLATYVLRFYFDENGEIEKKKLIGNVFSIIALVNIIIFIIGIIYIPILLVKLKINIPWNPYFKYAFIAFFLDVFSIIPLILYRVKKDAKSFVILNTSKVILQYILVALFVIKLKLGLVGFYTGNLIALFPFFFINLYLMFRFTILNINYQKIKSGLLFSLPLLPGSIAYILLNYGDRFFLEKYISLNDLGIYNISSTISLSLNVFIASVYKAAEPEFFSRYSQINYSEFVDKFKKIFLFFLYSLAMFFAIFTEDAMQIISQKYIIVYLYVPLILISVLMSGSNIIYGGILTAEKNTKSISKSVLIGTFVSFALNYILIPKIGLLGACFSSAFSFLTMNIFLYVSIRNKIIGYKVDIILLLIYILFIIPILFNSDLKNLSLYLIFKCILFIAFLILIFLLLKLKINLLKTIFFHSLKK